MKRSLVWSILLVWGCAEPPEPAPAGRTRISGLDEAGFIAAYKQEHALSASHDLVLVRSGASRISGLTFAIYSHVYAGVPVEGEGLSLHLRDGEVISAAGEVSAGLPSTRPVISGADALRRSEEAITSALRLRRGSIAWAHAPNPCAIALAGRGRSGAISLIYRCALHASRPELDYVSEVDAVAGNVLVATPAITSAWVPVLAGGTSTYQGDVGLFDAEMEEAIGDFRLRSGGGATFDAQHAVWQSLPAGVDIISSSAIFPSSAAPGVTAHWATRESQAWFEETIGVPVGAMDAFVNVDVANMAFHYSKNHIFFGNQPVELVSLDVAAHEVAHGWAFRNGFLSPVPVGEHASIQESFGDIVGQLVEVRTLGASDWIWAADIPMIQHRSLFDPTGTTPSPQPDVYGFGPWTSPQNLADDNGGAHQNDSIQNLWFYRLSFGGAGVNSQNQAYDVVALGAEVATSFLFTAFMEILLPGNGFSEMRAATMAVAALECGDFSIARLENHDAWRSVGVDPAAPAPAAFVSPADGAGGVAPWPVYLEWQADGGHAESAWEVEVSEDANFPPGATLHPVAQLGVVGGVAVGRANIHLDVNRTYYWRVRSLAGNLSLPACWRPAMRFTTSGAIPQQYGPSGGAVHPWLMEVAFSSVPGATHYQVQVARDSGFSVPVFGIKTFPAGAGDIDQVFQLTVPIDPELFWRVRAQYQSDGGENMTGDWSAGLGFGTITPEVELIAPIGGAVVGPWPVQFEWFPIAGGEFDIAFWAANSAYIHEYGIGDTVFERYFSAYEDHQRVYDVGVLGPPLGSSLEPEPESSRELGSRSVLETFWISAAGLEPALISPVFDPNGPVCVHYYDPAGVTFEWSAVPGATGYELLVLRDGSEVAFPTTQTQITVFDNWLVDHTVRFWRARAVSHGATGPSPVHAEYRVITPAPELLGPDNGTSFDEGEQVGFSYYPFIQGHYRLELFEGSGCGGALIGVAEGIGLEGETGAFIGGGLTSGFYSWRILTQHALDSCGPNPDFSTECRSFSVSSVPPPDVETAYCDVPVVFSGNWEPKQYAVYVGPGAVASLWYEHFEALDRIQVYHQGVELVDTGCVGGSDTELFSVPADAYDDYVLVIVSPDCLMSEPSTEWQFEVQCN